MIWPVKIIMPIGEEQTVYEPEYRVKLGFVRCWVAMVAGIAQSRELIVQLFYRDMLAASKQSLLGIAWTWVSPLIGIASWLFLNQVGVLMPGKSDVPYPLFVLLGTTIWGVFMAVFTSAASSLSANSNLIMHAHFSHQVLVAQQVAHASLSMVANLVLLAAAFTFFGVHPQWTALFFPLSLVPLLLLGVGIGMIVSVLSILVRDMTKVMTTLLGVLMFFTPVIYTPDVGNEVLQDLIWLNPLTYLVGGARDLMISGIIRDVQGYVVAVSFAVAVFLLSWRIFFISEQKVAEKL
ncbi:MAG: ABC transporter permease [Nitrospira sp.]|nr:ABC transporter permease [Nitrospira sp.]